jgi:integrase
MPPVRHAFISACASKEIDQRLIDEWVGHQTDDQRRRYRHLYPNDQVEALRSVFG